MSATTPKGTAAVEPRMPPYVQVTHRLSRHADHRLSHAWLDP